jgi:SEC-C motif
MSKEVQIDLVAMEANTDVSLAWDDVFGMHLQVKGGPEAAQQVADELKESGIRTRTEVKGVDRLRREGWKLVVLAAAVRNRSEEKKVRGLLLENGHEVAPVEGLECVPCPYGERLRPLLQRGSYFDGVKPATVAELGLGAEDGAELLRMAVDPEFDNSSHPDAVWGPVWAWFLIGELKPAGAGAVLVSLLDRLDTKKRDDAATAILPKVFGQMGPEMAQALTAVLRDHARSTASRWAAMDGLKEIALARPEARAEMVAILTAQLEEEAVGDAEVNGAIISALIDLEAVESAAVIEQAFRAKRVDEMIAGDWEEVQVAMGLKEASSSPPGIGLFDGAPVRRETPKVGRNDPCPCGSGKKFKKCCGG